MRHAFDGSPRGRRPVILLVALAVLALGFGSPVRADDPLDPVLGPAQTTLPNLVPNVVDVQILRPFVFDEPSQTFVEGAPDLYFDTWVQNFGTVPLQLAFGGLENPETAIAEQCVSWVSADAHVCREQVPVGGFSWHAEHGHFHFNEFASYQLRRLHPNGRVNYSPNSLVAASDKVSFCLIDSAQVRGDAFPVPFYDTCSPTVEGVSPGWSDIYTADLEGQQLPLDGLTDGRYGLVIRVDYADHIYETDNSDNVVEAILEISGGVRNISIVSRNYPS